MRDTIETESLVDTEWLEQHLADPRLRVVEVDVSPAAYNDGHIAGAVLWNIYRDLKDDAARESMIQQWVQEFLAEARSRER